LNFTAHQRQAIAADGNVLVMAGAGTGKTRTLVERAAQLLLDSRADVSLHEMLMVTFTEAAAAEMRQRIRLRLEEELNRSHVAGSGTSKERLTEQLALLDTAHICTLHSFCLELVRQHFYELELDPQLKVLDEDQAKLLAAETLDALFREHYSGAGVGSEAVLRLLQDYADGRELPIRELILHLHEFTQTRPDPAGWFDHQLALFSQSDPTHWRRWLKEGVTQWREHWLPMLRSQASENTNAHECARLLDHGDGTLFSAKSIASILPLILATDRIWPPKKRTVFRKPLKKFYEETAFLVSLMPKEGQTDPLAEDWSWVRHSMTTLLQLAREFGEKFAAAKRELGALDFHDLEQFALKLLWDSTGQLPTALARQWRQKLKLVFVDEYQDINAAQDCILTALSRDDTGANRFLVGDVKQSIYRFRQAAPHIFQDYAARWREDHTPGQVIDLSDNFRSHESILNFVNPLFGALMREELGGVDFDEAAKLRFGDPEGRAMLRVAASGTPAVEPGILPGSYADPSLAPLVSPHRLAALYGGRDAHRHESTVRVEINLLLQKKADEEEANQAALTELSSAEKEARLVSQRMLDLRASGYLIWDEEIKQRRPVDWKDMVILLRSPRGKVESFAKEFARLGVPLQAKRSGFFDSIEVLDLVSLLTLLDNPLQDVPAIAVLRSPLVGLSLNELATIRLAARGERFWTALLWWHGIGSAKYQASRAWSEKSVVSSPSPVASAGSDPLPAIDQGSLTTWQKVDEFLSRFARWRAASRHTSLLRRLELILNETSYLDWLLTQPRGEQRQANVQQLLALARRFDELQQQGLYRFLKMIEAHQETVGDREPAPLEAANAVHLMSIHQSKGLEFPVVVVADLAKRFNLSEHQNGVIFDEEFGLCPQVQPPETGQRYPSLPYWLARQRQRREALGEELRILYVGLTRAQDTLILTGTVPDTAPERWRENASSLPSSHQLLQANSYFDWLGPWLTQQAGSPNWTGQDEGEEEHWRWKIHHDRGLESEREQLVRAAPEESTREQTVSARVDGDKTRALMERLAWSYSHASATLEPAKTSVTAIRRKFADEADQESFRPPHLAAERFTARDPRDGGFSAEEIGDAHHRFLQWVSLERVTSRANLEAEAARLAAGGLITDAEASALNLAALEDFWASELGQRIRLHAREVRREWPFTVRMTSSDLTANGLQGVVPQEEFVVVQGVVDLAVVLPDEIWIVDFKTDQLTDAELPSRVQKYAPQLRLYGFALERICQKRITERWLHFLSLRRSISI